MNGLPTSQSPPPTEAAVAAVAKLLADELDCAFRNFEQELHVESLSWDYGSFGAIQNGITFDRCRKVLIEAVRDILAHRLPQLVALAVRQGNPRGIEAVGGASDIIRSIIAGHASPRKLLRRIFPAPDKRGILLPPGLTAPQHERVAVRHICKALASAIESEIQRVEHFAIIAAAAAADPATTPVIATPPARRRNRRKRKLSSEEKKEVREIIAERDAKAALVPQPRRQRRQRFLSHDDRSRRATIRELSSKELKGSKYCGALDERKIPIPLTWRQQGCPATYSAAYHHENWRKRIQDEKHRHSHSFTR